MATLDDPNALYRFFVREKPDLNHPNIPRRVFATRVHLTDTEANARFEVIERIEHTGLPRQKSAELARQIFD